MSLSNHDRRAWNELEKSLANTSAEARIAAQRNEGWMSFSLPSSSYVHMPWLVLSLGSLIFVSGVLTGSAFLIVMGLLSTGAVVRALCRRLASTSPR